MKFKALLLAALAVVALPARAEEALTESETRAIESVVRDYLLRNPDVIIEALQEFERRQQQLAEEQKRGTILAHREALLNDPDDPVGGNPEAAVTVVEFFDYRCPYCKSVAADMVETLEGEGDVRIVFKEFPILGPDSVFAAKAALAAHRQDRYREIHLALMGFKGPLTNAAVLEVAAEAGLDLDRLKADMEAPEIASLIDRTQALARAIGVGGTPAFVIGDRLIPGAVSMEVLKEAVAAARGS